MKRGAVVRASDSRPEGLGSMPNATKYPLSTHGIRVKADLPVGKNMMDRVGTFLVFELSDGIMSFAKKQVDESNIVQYITSKSGVLASPIGVAVTALLARNDTNGINEYPDYQLTFWEGSADEKQRIKPEVTYLKIALKNAEPVQNLSAINKLLPDSGPKCRFKACEWLNCST
ncbi:uncharacterized protein TNCV_4970191 [Trichonephila clavipes]|uniref:Uncharacterized protein n=1 Tax=Trichonephila clavipes TaxID=2585209 RepID=A0A8X6S6R7_TRICX|nr:uncharacterized protein TNCV_4970191 [Trichonephila clavipes]